MKKASLTFIVVSSILILSPGPCLLAQADSRTARPAAGTNGAPAGTDLTEGVHIASMYAEECSLRHYAGQQLWNTGNAELGTLKDFIVHAPSGRVLFAVVSSGGVLGMGNSLRIVPVEALHENWDNQRRLTVDIEHARWMQIPPLSDNDYASERFQITKTLQDELLQRFNAHSATTAAPAAKSPSGSEMLTGLARASTLRGKQLYAENRDVGEIENIIVDLEQGVAAALVDSSGGFTGTNAKYLIPLQQLSYDSPPKNPIRTSLTRADFDRAKPSKFGMTAIRRAGGDNLAPTGRTDSNRAPASNTTSDTLDASVAAVRQAIQNDAALAPERVQVEAENGRIILRGSVRNQAIKGQIETAARRAAPAGQVDSQLTVGNAK